MAKLMGEPADDAAPFFHPTRAHPKTLSLPPFTLRVTEYVNFPTVFDLEWNQKKTKRQETSEMNSVHKWKMLFAYINSYDNKFFQLCLI
jgi:hypothetical protein